MSQKLSLSVAKQRVLYWDSIPQGANPETIMIMLRRGWCWSMQGQGEHVRGFDTKHEANMELVDLTEPCACSDCLSGNGW